MFVSKKAKRLKKSCKALIYNYVLPDVSVKTRESFSVFTQLLFYKIFFKGCIF